MSTIHPQYQINGNIKNGSHEGNSSDMSSSHLDKVKLNLLKIPNDSTSYKATTNMTKHKLMTPNSIDKDNTSLTDALSFCKQKSVALDKDKKGYQKKCETIVNRIEALKKQEEEMKKKIIKINRQKVQTAQIQVDRVNRHRQIAEIRLEKDQEKVEKRKRSEIEHIQEGKNVKRSIQARKEENKKQYDKRKKESKRASSQIIEFRRMIEVNKKEFAERVKESSVDPKEIRHALRQKEEQKRIKSIEAKLNTDEKYAENLKKKLMQLEKEEEVVFQHYTKTRQENESILQSYSLNNSFSQASHKSYTKIGSKTHQRTKSADTSESLEDSVKNVKLMQQRYNEKLKELNALIQNEKAMASNTSLHKKLSKKP